MIEYVLQDGERRHVDLGWDYEVIREVVAGNSGSLDEVTDPAYVEWDLWDSNVMIRDGAIVSIIDHERAFYGDPLIEQVSRAPSCRRSGIRPRSCEGTDGVT